MANGNNPNVFSLSDFGSSPLIDYQELTNLGQQYLLGGGQSTGAPLVEQAQSPLHGLDPLAVEQMGEMNIPLETIIQDPYRAAQSLKDREDGIQDDLPRTTLFSAEEGADNVWAYLGQRAKQGSIQSDMNRIGYAWAAKKISTEEFFSQIAELEGSLPFQAEDWNTGWFLEKALGPAVQIVKQMLPTALEGLKWGTATLPFSIATTGPLAAVTAPAAFAAGMAGGVFKGASQENIGALVIQLLEKPFEMYPDLDNDGKYITKREWEIHQQTRPEYTIEEGYEPELHSIDEGLARSIAMGFGMTMGLIELGQFGTFTKLVGGLPGLRKLTNVGARNIIQSGSFRRWVGDAMTRTVGIGLAETGQEVVQDAIGYGGTRLAGAVQALGKKSYDISADAQQEFFKGVAEQVKSTATDVFFPLLLLGGAGGFGGATMRISANKAEARAQAKREVASLRNDGSTSFWFDQETGKDVSTRDVTVEEGDLLERDMVMATSILELARDSQDYTLPPLKYSMRTDGSLIAEDAMSAAMTKVLREAGVLNVRAVVADRTKGIADSKQAAEYFSDDPLKSALVEQFSNDTVAEIESKMLLLKLASSSSGLSLNNWLDVNFQEEGMFRKADTAATTSRDEEALAKYLAATDQSGRSDAPGKVDIEVDIYAGTPVYMGERAEVKPTIDRALINPPGAITDVTETMDAPTTRRFEIPTATPADPTRESADVSTDPTLPGAPTIHPDFRQDAPADPDASTFERQEDVEEPAVGAAQLRVRIGETMSRKAFFAKVEADAEAAGDEFLAQAARNVEMDQVEAIEGDVMTPAEHTVEVMPDLIEESGRLEAEAIRQRRANTHALWKQADRERREAAMAAELEPTDAAAPEITDVEDPDIEIEEPVVGELPYDVGEAAWEDLTPAFDTSIPAATPPVIWVDMDDNMSILSGLAEFNAARIVMGKTVSGKILRAVDGVTLEEAKAQAAKEAVLADFPESEPVARDAEEEVIPIKSDGETVGAVEFDENSKALLRAYGSMDTKSWLHGLAPVFRKMLPAREASVAARWAGAKHTIGTDGRVRWTWDDASNYKFASGFAQYLQEGKVSFPELQPIWDTLSKWTKASYAVNRTRLTKPIRDIYESFLVDEKSPSLGAYQSNIQMVGQVADMTFRSPVSSKILRLKSSDGRSIVPAEEGGAEGSPLVFVEALDTDGTVLVSRKYNDVDSAVRDISGVPTAENPGTIGDSSYRPHAAKQGPVSGFYGAATTGDLLPLDAGPEGSIHVGGQPVDSESFVGDVISQLEEAGQLRMREGPIAGIVTSWRRYDYATELLANGVKGPLFQVLSRDIDTGRDAEKRTRFDLNDIQRNKLLQRGWTDRQLRQLPGRMKEKVEVSGWKHKKAKDTWTIADLLSFNRHLRAGQNRVTLLERGFRDGPDGDLIRVDEEDIATLMRAYSTIPSELRDLGEGVVDELMDIIHEKMDPVHRKSRRRGLGYVPNYWDLERAPQDRSPEMVKEEMENADALDEWRFKDDPKLGVYEGMTHHRTRNSAPIVLRPLDFQLMRNIDRASMYVGFELPLKAARQLFEHPQARAAMERRMGKDGVRGLEKGLEGVARRWVDESMFDKTLQSLQRKVTVATLGGNIPVWIKQTLSYPLYGAYVPAKYLAAAAMRAVIPAQYQEMKKNLSAFTPTFMARSKGFDISLVDTLEKSAAGEAWGKRRITEMVMKGITYFDQRTVTTGSHAAYLQAINEFRTGVLSEELQRATQLTATEARALTADQAAEKAYEYANWVTVRTQPNFLPEHVSSFQRDKITRFLSMYSGYTNVAYNMLLRTRWRAMQEKTPQSRAAMLKAFAWIYIGNAAGNAMINYLKQVWLGNAPSEEELPSWVAGQFISNAAGHIYFVRDAVHALMSEYASYSPSPIYSAAKETYEAVDAWYTDLLEYGEVRASTVTKTLRVAGFATGFPLHSMVRYGEATIDRGVDLYDRIPLDDLFDPMIN